MSESLNYAIKRTLRDRIAMLETENERLGELLKSSDNSLASVTAELAEIDGIIEGDGVGSGNPIEGAKRMRKQVARLEKSLGNFYDKWENGIPCSEANEEGNCEDGASIGNACKLSPEEENEILGLIPSRVSAPSQEPEKTERVK
jgi:hypothetical protein